MQAEKVGCAIAKAVAGIGHKMHHDQRGTAAVPDREPLRSRVHWRLNLHDSAIACWEQTSRNSDRSYGEVVDRPSSREPHLGSAVQGSVRGQDKFTRRHHKPLLVSASPRNRDGCGEQDEQENDSALHR